MVVPAPVRRGRRRAPRIVDLATHPRPSVSLAVAAEYLDVSPKTARARIESGQLEARREGRGYRIGLDALAAYVARVNNAGF